MTVEIIRAKAYALHGMIVIDAKGGVWLTHARSWWSLLSHLWFWAIPGKPAWIQISTRDGKTRIQAKLLAKTHLKLGG
jgi:hypothetical protein